MKLVFLDVDGVLNCNGTTWRRVAQGIVSNGMFGMDPEMVARLRRIVEPVDARIVITSSWKVFGRDVIKENLAHAGFDVGDRIIGEVEGYGEAAILRWLEQNGQPEAFVVLEDSFRPDTLRDHWVQTTWAHGLQDEHMERAVAMLRAA